MPIEVGPEAVPASPPEEADPASCAETGAEPSLVLSWAELNSSADLVEGVAAEALELTASNNSDKELGAALTYLVDTGGATSVEVPGPMLIVPPHQAVSAIFDLRSLALPVKDMETSGLLLARARVTQLEGDIPVLAAVSPPLFWHFGSKNFLDQAGTSGSLTIYGEKTLEQTYRGGDLLGQVPPEMLEPLLEDIEEIEEVTPSRVFTGDVAIVTKGNTTPQDLADAGLINTLEPVEDSFPSEEEGP